MLDWQLCQICYPLEIVIIIIIIIIIIITKWTASRKPCSRADQVSSMPAWVDTEVS